MNLITMPWELTSMRAGAARLRIPAKALIAGGMLSDTAKTLVDFVELCQRKEAETGEPCTIAAH